MVPAAILVVIALILIIAANLYHFTAISRIHDRLDTHDEALLDLRQERMNQKRAKSE